MTAQIPFDNSYRRLPANFFEEVLPTAVSGPRLIALNDKLAKTLGLDPQELRSPEGVEILAGKRIPEGAEPIAMAYAGHQFGNFVPQLGDGRAILLGEIVDTEGRRRDLQLKGAGPTPFSRSGDGRAALGPVLREYVVSEAMAALGVPTTRALAAVITGDMIFREMLLPGGVLTRVASSHIRIGTFQFFGARGDETAVKALADHAIARHYPEIAGSDAPYRALLDCVVAAQAALVARWMHLGFIHGVMNTDNMSISGETIDYGPCAFMEAYDPQTVFSAIDRGGRYAYGNQPAIALWNLTRLAECLLPLLADDSDRAVEIATASLDRFADLFNDAHKAGLVAKIGLGGQAIEPSEADTQLAQDLLQRMAAGRADFTLTFRRLADAAADPSADASVAALFDDPASFHVWAARWHARLDDEGKDPAERALAMRRINPAIIPRNHRVEEAIVAAVEHDDFEPFERLVAAIASPYEHRAEFSSYEAPALPEERVTRTFCGT